MAENDVLKLNNVGMKFNLSKEKVDSLKEYFIKLLKGQLRYDEFWALKDISFSVGAGDRLGILGLNGAGKSTLLKVVAGVFKPTNGTVERQGVIAPLIELGAGFDPQYTGRENIYLYGAVLGYRHKVIDEKLQEIIDFSELKDFIDVPLKNYSSGMKARLGFAIATIVEPDILILDEVLSVGDAKFRKKSEAKLMKLIDKGITVLFVSHNTDQVRKICNKAMILEKGKVIYYLESKGKKEVLKDNTDEAKNIPIIVLVNEGTASASEVLAAALKESYGATLVGKTTYGKGRVQQTKKLEDGSMVKYTTALWLTPSEECIDEFGIQPDYDVQLEKNEEGLYEDTQLQKAEELLTR